MVQTGHFNQPLMSATRVATSEQSPPSMYTLKEDVGLVAAAWSNHGAPMTSTLYLSSPRRELAHGVNDMTRW
jgi:hypothetical protein